MKRIVFPFLAGALATFVAVPAFAAIADVLPGLSSDDLAVRNEADRTLFSEAAHAGRPDADAERQAYCREICQALAETPPALTALALVRALEHIGQAESVPTLTRLMNHEDAHVREAARMALAANPSPQAGAALLDQVRTADDPRTVIGILDALGARHHPRVVPVLSEALTDPRYAGAAAAALAREAGAGAARALVTARKPGDDSYLTRALIDLCVNARRTGNKKIAARVYRYLMAEQEAEHVRATAITGYLTLAESSSKVAMQFIQDPSEVLQAAVVEAASQIQSPRLQRRLAHRLPDVSPDMQLRILTMITRTAPAACEQWVAPLLDAEDSAIASAARAALAVVGTESSVPALVKAGAVDAMSRIRSPGMDEVISRLAASGTPEERAIAIRVLAQRQGADSTQALLDFARDPDEAVARTALAALAEVAPAEAMPDIVERMLSLESPARARQAMDAAVSALRRAPEPEATIAVLTGALAGADGTAQSLIYKVLVQAGSDAALAPVAEAGRSADAALRAPAISALTTWREPNGVAPLLELAQNTDLDLKEHALVIRGLARLLGSTSTIDLNACTKALEAARRTDEKKLVLGAIGQSDKKRALTLLEPYLADPELQAEAAAARDAIQKRLEKR